MTDFQTLLEAYRSDLNAELRHQMNGKRRKMVDLASGESPLVEVLANVVMRGGKRIRPALVYFGYRACGGTEDGAVRPLEVATEFLHTYLLIHDDIMDNADVRRGGPAAHVHFEREHERNNWHGDPSHYGPSMGILVGNLANAHAHAQFAEACEGAPDPVTLRKIFSTMEEEVIEGQRQEMRLAQDREMGPDRLERILQLKSGRYSVERPLELGAVYADASDTHRDAFQRFGRAAGGAFQLRDDLLGMLGDSDATGKPVGDDLREGKMTFLIYHTLQRTDGEERRVVREALGDVALGNDAVQRACEIMEQCGAADHVRGMIDERLTQAERALDGVTLEPDGDAFLRGLVDYLGNRTR